MMYQELLFTNMKRSPRVELGISTPKHSPLKKRVIIPGTLCAKTKQIAAPYKQSQT